MANDADYELKEGQKVKHSHIYGKYLKIISKGQFTGFWDTINQNGEKADLHEDWIKRQYIPDVGDEDDVYISTDPDWLPRKSKFCFHEWKEIHGLMNIYKNCKKCGMRYEDV